MISAILHALATKVALADQYTYDLPLPGNIGAEGNVSGIIVNLFQFGMLLAGILAFGMVVWAGVSYATSAGNAGKRSEAIDRVMQAFLGILLLVGAYVILYTVNPGLTVLELPRLVPLSNTATTQYSNVPLPNAPA